MAIKQKLNADQIGALKAGGFDSQFFTFGDNVGTFYGNGSGMDYAESLLSGGDVTNTEAVLAEFTTEQGYATILEAFTIASVLQQGNATKEVYFRLTVQQENGEELEAGRYSATSGATPKMMYAPTVPALGGGGVIRVRGEATTGNSTTVNFEVKVLKIEL